MWGDGETTTGAGGPEAPKGVRHVTDESDFQKLPAHPAIQRI